MKHLKIKVTRKKDVKDDAVTHYFYDEVDVDLIKRSKMDSDYLYAETDEKVKEGNDTIKITKKEFEDKLKPQMS